MSAKTKQMHSDFVRKILYEGIENIIFMVSLRPVRTIAGFISYTTSNDPELIVPCRIIEDRYKVDDDYKIDVESLIPGYGKKSYYASDLNSLIQSGDVQMFIASK